jgi:endonuclease/exonuclease/phosphatase (EEP) superfamily protein YafD
MLLMNLAVSVAQAAERPGAATPDAPVARAVTGKLKIAVANIPNRTSDAGFATSMTTLTSRRPQVVMLNEVSRRTLDEIRAAAPGYDAYRKDQPDRSTGGSQALNNVVMWRTKRWTKVRGGRIKLVDDDQGFQNGRRFTWDRYATWVTLRRVDGAKASFISTHLPTNPARFPRQHGDPELSRVELYAQGMDVLVDLVSTLSKKGPVLVGGDMNSHPNEGDWTAVAKMTAAGFAYAKDRGVMYLFYQSGASLVRSRELSVASSHPALVTTLDMGSEGTS